MVLVAPAGRRPRASRTISSLTKSAYFENQVCLRVCAKMRVQYPTSELLSDCPYQDVLTCHADRDSLGFSFRRNMYPSNEKLAVGVLPERAVILSNGDAITCDE
jgi:hypothetical protein